MKNARDADAASAKDVAHYDALGKELIAHMYTSRAAAKVASAKAAIDANVAMHDVQTVRLAANAAHLQELEAKNFAAHKEHLLHIKEHYANLESVAADELAADHAAWKEKYAA